MNTALETKEILVTPPAAKVDNAPFTTATIDTFGYRYLRIKCYIGDIDVAFAALSVQESDDPGMAGATTIPGTVGGTNFALPTASSDNSIGVFNINLDGRKRYIDLVATGGDGTTGTFMTVVAELSRPSIMPNNAAERGATAFEVIV